MVTTTVTMATTTTVSLGQYSVVGITTTGTSRHIARVTSEAIRKVSIAAETAGGTTTGTTTRIRITDLTN
jgi:hypothetical protein